jgi:hypothetical protein
MGEELYCSRGESVGRLGVAFKGVVVVEGVLVDMALAGGRPLWSYSMEGVGISGSMVFATLFYSYTALYADCRKGDE